MPEQVLDGDPRFPADLFSGGADGVRLAARTIRRSPSTASTACRTFNSGGAPCPVEVLEQFERTIGRPLNEGYGLSETSPVTHIDAAARRPARSGTHRRAVARHRHEDRRRRDRHARDAGRRDRRAVHRRPAGDEGLLEPARGDARTAAHARRRPHLVPHRRHRAHGRGRLHLRSSSARRT